MKPLLRLTFVETKMWLREVTPPVFSLVLPVVILLIFGSFEDARQPNAALGDNRRLDTTVPSMAVVVSMAMIAFFMLPGALAIYRDKGVLRRLATTPVRPTLLLTSQVLVNLVMAAAGVTLLVVVGVVALGMRAPHPLFLPVFGFGAIALCAVGLLVASVSPNVRVAQVYSFGLFFPSAFFAGVYLPKEEMPALLARISDLTPLGAFRQSIQDAWSGQVPQTSHLSVLAATAVLTSILAVVLYRRTVVD